MLNILLIEDDDVDVMTVRRAMSKSKVEHTLEVMRQGAEAFEFLRQAARDGNPLPDLVLLDLNLPFLSGLELLAQRSQDPVLALLPMVVLTTSDHENDIRRALESGATGYFVKPIAFDDFAEMMEAVCLYWSHSSNLSGQRNPWQILGDQSAH